MNNITIVDLDSPLFVATPDGRRFHKLDRWDETMIGPYGWSLCDMYRKWWNVRNEPEKPVCRRCLLIEKKGWK